MLESPEIVVHPSIPGDFMQSKVQISDQGDLFRSRLDQMLDRQHELYRLADQIDWSFFEREFGPLKADHRMDRSHLKGPEGDKINALLAACGYNLSKLLKLLLF